MKKHSDIYLDHITATKCPEKTKERLLVLIDSNWASPDAPYSLGQKNALHMKEAYAAIHKRMHIADKKAYLTHSSSETLQLILHARQPQHILTSINAQRSTMEALQAIQNTQRTKITFLPIGPRGYIEQETIIDSLTDQPSLLLLPSVDLCSGVLQPIDEMYPLLQARNVSVVFDITHTFGKTHFSLSGCAGDDIIFDLHALGSPIGLACLLSKEEVSIPDFHEKVLLWSLMDSLLEEEEKNTFLFSTEVVRLRDLFESKLKTALPDVWYLHQEEDRISNLSTCIFPKVKNEALLFLLNKKNVFASIGGGDMQTLTAQLAEQGYAPHIAQGAISFSFSTHNTEDEVDTSVARIKETYDHLVKIGLQDE